MCPRKALPVALLLFAVLSPREAGSAGGGPGEFRSALEARLAQLQFPPRSECGCGRALLYIGAYYEGFACAVHQVGMAQMVALATNRTLVVPDKDIWGYVSGKHCAARNWGCLFRPLSSCTEKDLRRCGAKHAPAASHGLQNYHVMAGPARVVTYLPRGSSSKYGSVHKQLYKDKVLKSWLKAAGGVFHLRSEVQRWLWRPLPELQEGVRQQMDQMARAEGLPEHYAAVHVRASDNLANTQKDFGIAPSTYATGNFLAHLQRAAVAAPTAPWGAALGEPLPVYLSTDNVKVIKELQEWHSRGGEAERLRFIYNRDSAVRAKYKDGLLHKKNKDDSAPAGMVGQTALDAVVAVEMLAGARYLLGSQISNIFRLASELHCAARNYTTCAALAAGRDGRRIAGDSVQTVDVGWYEDP